MAAAVYVHVRFYVCNMTGPMLSTLHLLFLHMSLPGALLGAVADVIVAASTIQADRSVQRGGFEHWLQTVETYKARAIAQLAFTVTTLDWLFSVKVKVFMEGGLGVRSSC